VCIVLTQQFHLFRTSATNAAKIYDLCLASPALMDTLEFLERDCSLLRPSHVWDGFVLLSLLEDLLSRRPGSVLVVPHTGEQKNRFNQVMQERNLFMSQSGQPEWAHYCNKCCRVWGNENGTDNPS